MKWCIYKHTNKINGKSYIGQTMQSFKNRWGIDGKNYKRHNLFFWNAIQKYGWDNFEHVILEENIPSKEKANEREIYYIKLYRTYVEFEDCKGYNLTLGGDNRQNLGNAVYQIDMKTLKPINEFSSIRLAERETNIKRNSIMECCKKESWSISGGGYYWCFKKDYSTKWKPKQRKDRTDTSLNKAVYQIDMKTLKVIRKFKSFGEISRELKCKPCGISLCCQRKLYQNKNFFWCYAEDYNENWKPIEKPDVPRTKKCVRISINNLKDVTIYNSLKEASIENNLNDSQISECCKRKHAFAGEFYWAYLEDYNEEWKPMKDLMHIKVICIETKQIYNSVKEASLKTNTPISGIRRACNKERKTSNNFHWAYLNDYDENYKIPLKNKERIYVCVETGETYKTAYEIEKKLGFDASSILKCCKNPKRTCGHFHWKYINK